MTAFHSGSNSVLSESFFPANTTLANASNTQTEPWEYPYDLDLNKTEDASFSPGDGLRVLMLNTTSYDSAYVAKMQTLITKRIPGVTFTDYWGEDANTLSQLLALQDIVVVTYPAKGSSKQVRAFGKILKQFAQQGGSVVFSGTDQFGILQCYGLFDLDFGYFCSGIKVHEDVTEHPIFSGTPADFALANYVYPLDISDPNFVVLADINGYPAVGVKSIGSGKAVYLGLEYYYDEPVSSLILENTLRWLTVDRDENISEATPVTNDLANWQQSQTIRRSEERLFAGTGGSPQVITSAPTFELKVYPNPYFEKGILDISLEKSAPVTVEMTNETGGLVAILLPYRTLSQGIYRLELPNVSSGIYFVKCQIGNQTTVKKVVKMTPQ